MNNHSLSTLKAPGNACSRAHNSSKTPHVTQATYCLSCAELVLTVQMYKIHESLKAVRDNRNILAPEPRIPQDTVFTV